MSRTATTRVTARDALTRGVRTAGRAWLAALVASVSVVGGYLAAVVLHGVIFRYDFFTEPAPSPAAEVTLGFVLLGYFALALYGVTMWYGGMAVMARQELPVGTALRRSVSALWRDVWWAMPTMAVALIATVFVVPGPILIAPFAVVGAVRVNRVRVRPGIVGTTYGRAFAVALVPTGLVVLVWLGGALAAHAPSPPTWLAVLLCTGVAWLSFLSIACTAGAAVALVPEHEPRPAMWAPPSYPVRWAPPSPMVPMPRTFAPGPPRKFPGVRIAWIVVICAMFGVLFLGGIAVMGDPYPLSRSGVLRDDRGLQVVNAACPGDRLLRVELRERGTDVAAGPVRWVIAGNAAVPARLVVGEVPAGMSASVPLSGPVRDDEALQLVVETQQLFDSYPVDFTAAELIPGTITSGDATYDDFDAFLAAMDDEVPCDDPAGEGAKRSILAVVTGIEGALLVLAAVLVVVDVIGGVRRRRATMR